MDNELLTLRGRLGLCKKIAEVKEIEISIDVDELRALASKYTAKSDLQTDKMMIVVNRLNEAVERLRGLRNEIASLEEDLGEA